MAVVADSTAMQVRRWALTSKDGGTRDQCDRIAHAIAMKERLECQKRLNERR